MSDMKGLPQAAVSALIWGAFAILVLTGASIALNACDFGLQPLSGLGACEAPAADAALESERAKEAQLQSRLHAAEIHLALLPACQKPLPQPLPELSPIAKIPDAAPAVNPKPVQTLTVPKQIADLKGCWQSIHGDLEIYTDDAARKHVGQARICFCFRSNGRGQVQISFTDGDICRADLIARVLPSRMLMHHDRVNCRRHPFYNGADISCGNSGTDQTECEIQNLGELRQKYTERFISVSDEYCGWNG